MTETALTLKFAAPALPETGNFVLLEQEAWDPYINYLTKAGVIGYLNAKLFNAPQPASNCASADGSYTTTLYAYPSQADLTYAARVSWGVIGDRMGGVVDYTEVIQCDLLTEIRPKYPAVSITRYEWIGDTYDREGSLIPKPEVTLGEQDLTLSQPVYGTLFVTYKVVQHRYPVAVSPRPEAVENKLTSFAYALWSGGNEFMELEAPDGAEGGECNGALKGGSSINFNEGDPDNPGYVDGEDEIHEFDYCTGEELTDD